MGGNGFDAPVVRAVEDFSAMGHWQIEYEAGQMAHSQLADASTVWGSFAARLEPAAEALVRAVAAAQDAPAAGWRGYSADSSRAAVVGYRNEVYNLGGESAAVSAVLGGAYQEIEVLRGQMPLASEYVLPGVAASPAVLERRAADEERARQLMRVHYGGAVHSSDNGVPTLALPADLVTAGGASAAGAYQGGGAFAGAPVQAPSVLADAGRGVPDSFPHAAVSATGGEGGAWSALPVVGDGGAAVTGAGVAGAGVPGAGMAGAGVPGAGMAGAAVGAPGVLAAAGDADGAHRAAGGGVAPGGLVGAGPAVPGAARGGSGQRAGAGAGGGAAAGGVGGGSSPRGAGSAGGGIGGVGRLPGGGGEVAGGYGRPGGYGGGFSGGGYSGGGGSVPGGGSGGYSGSGGGHTTGGTHPGGAGAGSAGAAAAAQRGGMPVGGFAPMGMGGRQDGDGEHKVPAFLVSTDNGKEIFGTLPLVAPSVIGQ